jgi:hypothetical protein
MDSHKVNKNRGENAIKLSIVVRIVGGGDFLARLLDHLIAQVDGSVAEILVVYDFSIEEALELKPAYPQIKFLEIGAIPTQAPSGTHMAAHERIDRRTAFGLSNAKGGIICLLEDYDIPDPDWYEQVLAAHRLPFGIIGGAIDHAGEGALNWAVYFLDFGRYQLPLREGRVDFLSDANLSYKRESINRIQWLWKDRYNEASVNWKLSEQGDILWQRPQIIVRQDRGELRFKELLKERYDWGKVFGIARTRMMSPVKRFLYIVFSPAIAMVMLTRITWKVFKDKRNRIQLLQSYPALVILAFAWTLGELGGYLSIQE